MKEKAPHGAFFFFIIIIEDIPLSINSFPHFGKRLFGRKMTLRNVEKRFWGL